MKNFRKTAIAAAAAHIALMASGAVLAQDKPAADSGNKDSVVVVVGQRAALESAQKIKQNSDEIVDSVVADDIGKLPDKSVTEVLQRITGVTIDRTMNRASPQQGVGDGIAHFAAEGTGVSIRGLSYVRSELNGRDSFSANGGRSLSFEDVPPELMAGVDVYKNPSAEQIEGGIGGLVNLRTALPFDFKGRKGALSVEATRSELRGKTAPSFSGLVSDRWDTGLGQFGALVDVARSRIDTRSDGMQISPYIPRTDAVSGDTSGKLRWISPGGSWTSNNFEREREGMYGALQWKKDSLSSALTFFRSKYKVRTTEAALFQSSNPNTLMLDPGATFDDQGALLTGTLRAPTEPGVGMGTDSRGTGRDSTTRDLSWNLAWRASDQWQFRTDLQHTRATSDGYDNTIGLGGYMSKSTVDLRESPPLLSFDAQDRAELTDPSRYYWGFAQEHRDQSVATQSAARLDAKYSFDNPVLNDLRFGVRFTERDAETRSTHDTEWAQITQSWAVGDSWQPLSSFAYLNDPRFAGGTNTHTFSNFFNGKVPMPPQVIVPNIGLTEGTPPPSLATLHSYTQMVCKNPCTQAPWTPAPFGDDKGLNEQNERTKAAYAQLRFGFDRLPYPVDGNVGLRVVRTNMRAQGYTLFTPPTSTLPGVPLIPAQSEKISVDNSYTNALPSLNLRMKVGNELQFRTAFSQGMTRPEFYQMQAYTTLNQNVRTRQDAATNTAILESISYTGNARGNPLLKPTLSNNVDVTAEYYFGRSSSLTVALFNKRLKDIIIGKTSFYSLQDTAGQPHDFMVTAPVNGAKGRASGVEIGYQQYFDKLPGLLSGLGVSGNYTYIDSSMNLGAGAGTGQGWCTPEDTAEGNIARDLNGCDTDGRLLGGLPLTGMSKNAYNLALLYDKGPVSARLAYSWRSKYLQAANAFGTADGNGIDRNPASPNFGQAYSVNYALPTWGGSYGQLDLGIHYKVSENLSVAIEGQNLTDSLYKQYMQQGIGMKERSAFYAGRRYTLQARYSF